MNTRTENPTRDSLQPVVQEDRTGCAIACVAALTRQKYAAVKHEAVKLGIAVDDPSLWTSTMHMRRLLERFGIRAGHDEHEFMGWARLPDRALLAIKWHREKSGPAWHWVVFVRDASGECVLDPKRALRANRRSDFGRMKPKWFIPVEGPANPTRGNAAHHARETRGSLAAL